MARLANELVFGDEEGKTTTDDTVPAIRHTHTHTIITYIHITRYSMQGRQRQQTTVRFYPGVPASLDPLSLPTLVINESSFFF